MKNGKEHRWKKDFEIPPFPGANLERKKEGSRLTNSCEPVGRLSSRSFRVLLAGLSAFLSSTRGKILPFQAQPLIRVFSVVELLLLFQG